MLLTWSHLENIRILPTSESWVVLSLEPINVCVLAYFLYLRVIPLNSQQLVSKSKSTNNWTHLCKIHKLLWKLLPLHVCKRWEFSKISQLLRHTNIIFNKPPYYLTHIDTSEKNTSYSFSYNVEFFSDVSSWLLKSSVIHFCVIMRPFGARWNGESFQILIGVFLLNLIIPGLVLNQYQRKT